MTMGILGIQPRETSVVDTFSMNLVIYFYIFLSYFYANLSSHQPFQTSNGFQEYFQCPLWGLALNHEMKGLGTNFNMYPTIKHVKP